MMSEYTDLIAYVALAISLICLIGLFFSLLNSRQTIQELHHKLAEAQGSQDAILETNKGLSLGAVSLTERLARIEQEFSRLHEDVDRLSLTEQDNRAFTQAIKLAGKGANVDELVETCELSTGEAELIVLLHSQRANGMDDLAIGTEAENEHTAS